MADLTKIRSSTIGSENFKYFVEVPDDLEDWTTKSYHLAFILANSNAVDTGAEEEDIPDVTSKVAGYAVTSYKMTITQEGPFLTEDPVCNYLKYIIDNFETGPKSVVNIVRLDENAGTAVRYTSTCKVTQAPGGDAQGKAQIAADYRITSEPEAVNCTYDKSTGVATVTEIEAND